MVCMYGTRRVEIPEKLAKIIEKQVKKVIEKHLAEREILRDRRENGIF